ncbi:hypothetical protein [Pseudodesulfovibrio indicus]|jgi:sulfur relay (sulfurtransferase) complex TusBCD TusD component (DsrE family)|uniref:Sulfur reduction protein DsrE n=1 Tax=Pseudodesulfovibrio indicus TaxID=1716143 RepID=A0A126QP78_9BACT|nr:hypothetical protein [Pseudodesulfovibrio indicus]AMK11731.1 hypothetical protein AWY79_11715 [Pseudodesulfovibrio indicus]TDT88266.1 hypothetical protein EDC59_10679 [Pseudodesulfovibrio indicus]
MKRILVALILCCLLASTAFAGEPKRVFTSVTTDDVNKAAMAIKFTHNIMKNKGVKATLFFNVYGVLLVNDNIPSPIYPSGQSIQDLVKAFIADGGVVLACPMCMKNVGGMTKADLMAGVLSDEGAGVNAAVLPDTLALSY